MNKTEITKAQGKVSYKVNGSFKSALVLDTTTLYYERSSWGSAYRYHKSQTTTCKQDHLGCVTNGYLVLVVTAYNWTPNMAERIAKAEAFIEGFTGTAADLLDEKGYVNRNLLPEDVNVILVNNRNLGARAWKPQPEPQPEPVREVAVADSVTIVEDARLVVKVAVGENVTYPWLRADNAAKAYAKEFGNGAKLVRKSAANGIYVYNWA